MGKVVTTGFLNGRINGIKIKYNLPCNTGNYTQCHSRNIQYIVMHYTGNRKDTPKNNAKYFRTGGRNASAHFFVGNRHIFQSVKLRDRAWHCGTSGTYYHRDCRNANSIGIEMCCTAGNYKISKHTIKNAAHLCAELCKKIRITADTVDKYVLRHWDITHKTCPAQMVNSAREWKEFKEIVKEILKNKK